MQTGIFIFDIFACFAKQFDVCVSMPEHNNKYLIGTAV